MDPKGRNNRNVRQFSWCTNPFGLSDPGVWVWNDFKPAKNPLFPGTNFSTGGMSTFPLLHPKDPFYWSIEASNVSIAGESFGCPFGCEAIIDTGTSYISLTHSQVDGLEKSLNKIKECSEEMFDTLPPIEVMFGGEKFPIPAN